MSCSPVSLILMCTCIVVLLEHLYTHIASHNNLDDGHFGAPLFRWAASHSSITR